MRETRRVADKAREMQTQRAALLAELRRELRDDDVTRALLAEPDAPRDRVFRDHLERHTPRVKVIEQNLAAQENIINRLTTLYAAYGDSRRLLTDVLRKRDAVINGIVAPNPIVSLIGSLSKAKTSTEPSAECYPEHVYPTSARPPPVGSEATEPARSSFDGVTSPAAFPNAYVPPSSRAPAYTDTSNQYDYSVKPFNSPQETPTYGYAAVPQYPAAGVPELGAGLAQLQLAPDGPYAHTYFSGQPPAPAACRHTHTYSRAPHAAHTASSSAGAPYDSYGAAGADMTSIPSVANSYEINPRYSEGVGCDVTPQGFILASGESSTTLVSDASSGHYGIPANTAYVDPSLARLDAIDKPIKSHTKGEALSSYYGYGGGAVYQPERHPQGYVQSYQNHPGYMFNSATGSYDYDYGSHNSQAGTAQAAAWSAGLYTSAGTYDTVQSAAPTFRPSDSSFSDTGNEQTSVLSQESAPVSITPMTLGYESNPEHAVAPAHSSNTAPHSVPVSAGSQPAEQVSVSSENPKELSAMKTNNDADVPSSRETRDEPSSKETRDEPTAFDLLADIDFTIEQKPLTPEIKVPPMAEKNVARSSVMAARALSTPAPIPPVARPPRVDIFSDPALLNRFTQEVHNLKTLVETLGRETPSGLTPLDSKLTLDSDPDAYINASHYKQLGPWCIPLVISKVPEENEDGLFWKAMLENKMNCVVCLMSEVETAGRCRLPGAIGQSVTARGGDVRITLQHVTRAAHWTCRTLALERGTRRHSLQHFQIHVYPDNDAVLRTQRAAGGGACLTCGEGAGRSGGLALLLLLVCQLRAGDVRLCGTTQFNGEAVSGPAAPFVSADPSGAGGAGGAGRTSRETFEEMRQSAGLKSGNMKDPLNYLDPLWSLKKK
ncbi:unnamed protein product [Leptidea sinapis]|uniref:Tyrosine-protein phosphatase domain-containing protein n=1 Tax=Leptidea sinapis TaxID=189913 RepID=A0A5E4QWD9_9NEOP|nr:unnamed protein product [Leptidea sinapis]